MDALSLSHKYRTAEHSRKITAATLFIYALLITAISLYLNRVRFGIGDDYSRIAFPFKMSGMSYRSAVHELATNPYNGGQQVGAFFDMLGPYLTNSMDGFQYIRVAHLVPRHRGFDSLILV